MTKLLERKVYQYPDKVMTICDYVTMRHYDRDPVLSNALWRFNPPANHKIPCSSWLNIHELGIYLRDHKATLPDEFGVVSTFKVPNIEVKRTRVSLRRTFSVIERSRTLSFQFEPENSNSLTDAINNALLAKELLEMYELQSPKVGSRVGKARSHKTLYNRYDIEEMIKKLRGIGEMMAEIRS